MAYQIRIGNVDQIPKGEARIFEVNGLLIAVYHTHSGELFATQPDCPHRGGPLADGLIGGEYPAGHFRGPFPGSSVWLCPIASRADDPPCNAASRVSSGAVWNFAPQLSRHMNNRPELRAPQIIVLQLGQSVQPDAAAHQAQDTADKSTSSVRTRSASAGRKSPCSRSIVVA